MNLFGLAGLSVGVSCLALFLFIWIFGKTRLHRALQLFNLAVSIWGFGLFLVGISESGAKALAAWRMAHWGGLLVAPTYYYFVCAFTGIQRRKLLFFAYLQASILILVGLIPGQIFVRTRYVFDLHYLESTLLYTLAVAFYIILVVLSYYELLRFLPGTKGRQRTQALYIIFGFLVGFAGGTSTFLPIFHLDLVYPSGAFGVTVYCLVVTYAIFRHRLMDIHVAFKRSLIYSLSAGLLTGLFIILVLGMTKYLSAYAEVSPFSVTVVSALIIAFAFAPLKNRVQFLVDKVFYRTTEDYYKIVQTTSHELASSIDLKQTCGLVVNAMFQTLKLQSARLLSVGDDTCETICRRSAATKTSDAGDGTDPPLCQNAELAKLAAANEAVIVREELALRLDPLRAAALDAELVRFGGEVVAPILIDGELAFMVVLGEKRSRDAFSSADVDFIKTVANQAAVALKNATLYEELRAANEQLREEISEREKAENALRNAAQEWRTTFDSAGDVVILIDDESRVLRTNKAGAAFFKLSYKDMVGRPLSEAFHRAGFDQDLGPLSGNEHPRGHEEIELCFPERGLWLHVTLDPVRNAEEKDFSGSVVMIRDVTHLKKMEAEQQKLHAQLVQAEKMEAIGRLAGGVAHDLNNVLNAIVAYPDLILSMLPEDSALRKHILTIQRSGLKAAAIVQDLLTLARRGVTVKKVTNINNLVREYLASPECQQLLSLHSRVRIVEDLEPELWNIEGSSLHLTKTLMNLVSNAAEALPAGGEITITTRNRSLDGPRTGREARLADGDYVLLVVSDNGIGIAPEDLQRIFEPFFTTKVMGRSGTGLGMTIVWGTVRDHLGMIEVESTPGKGTTMFLYLPRTLKVLPTEEPTLSGLEFMGNNERILVVDDIPEQREVAQALLEQLGYSVTVVASGEEAIRQVEATPFDLVILDMIMDPGLDGLDTYRRIIELRPGAKAIIASGFSETERAREALRLGAGAYLLKPYTMSKIGAAVRAELGSLKRRV
ncbi:MAG TPA: response regulator [Candidatus Methanoperedens sp.]|nr:response regulator [Candidatus Methanoperedens sp.]